MFQLNSRRRVIITASAAFLMLILLSGKRPSAARLAVAQQGSALGVVEPRSATNTEQRPTDQIIVKFVDQTLSQADRAVQAAQLDRLSRAAGVPLELVRPMAGDAVVLGLPEPLPAQQVESISAALETDPVVLYAEPDRILQAVGRTTAGKFAAALFVPGATAKQPDDTLYANQWHYRYNAGIDEGVNLPPAWDKTTGSKDIVVGVIDNGVLDHVDLSGRMVSGYDFISNPAIANDGDGRDPDPSDPGDWEPSDTCYPGSPSYDSSWHGTHVAGTIGAATNNGKGVAGVNWQARILPVRVLGRCGGYVSDVLDGSQWAAGFDVPGVPKNGNPARVINLSLGGPGDCSQAEQEAINRIVNSGTLVVVAAGNQNVNVFESSPANCSKVVAVAATDRRGDRALYSNYGSGIDISAPGGSSFAGVLSTTNSGDTVPKNDSYGYYAGTSMSAPHVSGVASLLIGQDPSLSPAQVLDRLADSARDFPDGSSCNSALCGAGIVDAASALYDGAPPTPTPTSTPAPVPLAAPTINDIVNSDGDGNFAVVWSSVPKADTYQVNQKRNNLSWQKVYEGPNSSLRRIDMPDGTYCYRARALNAKSTSVWSAVECTVAGTPAPTPTATPPWKPTKFIFLPLV